MSTNRPSNVILPCVIVSLFFVTGLGCPGGSTETDGESSGSGHHGEASAGESSGSGVPGGGTGRPKEKENGEHGHGVRLGLKMQNISHRFAAIWYAGNAERPEMLDYQVHELQETIEQIEQADIEENGIDVAEQLDVRVATPAEEFEKLVANGKLEKFREQYRETIERCNSCHTATEHGFLEVTVPERNPYPNLRLEASDEERPSHQP